MVDIKTSPHFTLPCKNPIPARPCVIAEINEKANENIPSKDKIRNKLTSILKVSKTHFKLHKFETIEAEFRASIAQ